MQQRKVRHAIVRYTVDDGRGNTRRESAYRGQTITVNDDEAATLDRLGATVAVDAELTRPGYMIDLPVSPTDEEVIAWVLSATTAEVARLAAERPELAVRLRAAQTHVVDERATLAAAIEVAETAGEGVETIPPTPAQVAELEARRAAEKHAGEGAALSQPAGTTAPAGAPPLAETPGADAGTTADAGNGGTPGEGEPSTDPSAAQIVEQNAREVVRYVSEHPEQAAAVLAAENERAARENNQPRETVVRAVEAAAGHTQ